MLGARDGDRVGETLGREVVGEADGAMVGLYDGRLVTGDDEGRPVEGVDVGALEGLAEGVFEKGDDDGEMVGDVDGELVGPLRHRIRPTYGTTLFPAPDDAVAEIGKLRGPSIDPTVGVPVKYQCSR